MTKNLSLKERHIFNIVESDDQRPQKRDPTLYNPLLTSSRQFRLLILEPCINPGEVIRCNLISESLDSDLHYEAVSYTWGEPVNEAEIIVNFVALPVRKNLWEALRHLRATERRTLWIDAVCINQQNVPERNAQVKMMRQIYERAQKVVIWLGIQSDESSLAFNFMKFISSDRRKRSMKSEKLDGTTKYVGLQEELEAVRKLCQRPYWQRLWIVQEVVVSQEAELYCGKDHMPWDDFSVFQKCLEDGDIELDGDDRIQKSSAFNLDQYRVYNRTDYSNLIELLEPFSSSLCFEVRDKIYGLVGLARDATDFRIDYSRSLYDIFIDVMGLQDKEDCALLMACSQFIQRLLKEEVGKSAHENSHSLERLFGALGYETGIVKMISELDSEPTMFQTISTEEKLFMPLCEDWRRDIELLLQWERNGRFAKRMHVASGKLSHAVTGGMTFKEYKRLRISKSQGRDRTPMKPVPWGQLNQPISSPDLVFTPSEDKILQCFIDSRGYVGVASCGIRTSDTICQFSASDVVAILRWQEVHSCYSLVGSAVFPIRRNEADTPVLKDPNETFQFSVPTAEECVKPISLWLTAYNLQRLTQ
ncbi:HET-domain-containing protein [Hyaloscypha bicolor E]|uniref:HET-domain-containing protein n=1 Tax=Hyaloscypha bicolor E TaxID=1095630 RepID=A0A2J6SP32_9HELO|nr:HET-domain-containing protein [Hyaloscypha bicolor E]PMD52529.1 HET-domain-containing protein [Hyaloscypha bicolor E]